MPKNLPIPIPIKSRSLIIKALPQLKGAKIIMPEKIKNIKVTKPNNSMKLFSNYVPIHVNALNRLKDIKLNLLSAKLIKDIREVGLDLEGIQLKQIREIINSPAAKEIRLPDVIKALEFNAELDGVKIPIPTIFDPKNMLIQGKKINIFANKNFWEVDFFGISTQQSITIPTTVKSGLHARPMAELTKTAASFRSDIKIMNIATGTEANAKSIMEALMLVITEGTMVKLTAEGPDAEEAIKALSKIVNPKGK